MTNPALIPNVPEINLNKQVEINITKAVKVEEKKEEKPMKNMSIIHNDVELIAALTKGGIPANLANDVALFFSANELRKVAATGDTLTLTMMSGIGEKRAERICEILKGRIATIYAGPEFDALIPDGKMYTANEYTLTFENGQAVLSPWKYKNEKKVLKNNEPVKNVIMKRYGPLLQKAQEIMGREDRITFLTKSQIPVDWKDPIKECEMQKKWHRVTHYGIKMPNGELWVPGVMGTNAKMQSKIHWLPMEHKEEIRKWALCGAQIVGKKVNKAKHEAYIGLLLPYTKELLLNVLNPKMEVLTPEWENEHEGKNTLITPDGSMIKKETFNVAEFDGMVVIHLTKELIDKMGLTRAERRRLMRAILKFNGGTMRGPWRKGLIVTDFDIHAALRDEGVSHIDGKPIEDIAIFGDMSTFKASIGEDGLYQKFEDYAAAFNDMGHRYGVLLENHGPKKTFLPDQQLQAAHGCDQKYIEEGAKMEVEYLKAALDPKVAAVRYEPYVIAQIAQDDESVMNLWFTTEMACNGYKKEYMSAMAGRTHGNNVTGFVVKDLIAYVQWIAYTQGIREELPTGCLGKYEVFAPEAGTTGEAVASRNPVIANYGLPVVNVVDTVGEYDKYFKDGFAYIMVGIHDDLCKLLRMDHDGDKIRLTFDEWFINAVKSIDQSGEFAEWDNFGTVDKVELNDLTDADFWDSCTVSPSLGMNVDMCSKLIGIGGLATLEDNMVADYMMNKGTDVKQGANGSSVGGDAGIIWKAMKKQAKDAGISAAMWYGKKNKGVVIDMDEVSKDAYSNRDIIREKVRAEAPVTLKYEGDFNLDKILHGSSNFVQELVGSYKDKETGEYVNYLFDDMVSRNKAAWEAMDESAKTTGFKEFTAWQKLQAMKELEAFAVEHKVTMAEVYDTIARYVVRTLGRRWNENVYEIREIEKTLAKTKNKEERAKLEERIAKFKSCNAFFIVIARTFIQWFGDEIAETYCINTNMGFLPAVDEPMEAEEDFLG